jgi:thioredoxin 1
MVAYIESYEEYKNVIADSELTVIDYTASWCGPCKIIAPIFEKLHEKYPNANFAKIDVDNEQISAVCNENHISSMPTFIFYKNGVEVFKFSGANVKKLEQGLEKHY